MKKSILFLLALFSVTMTTQAVDYYYKGNQTGWSATAPMSVSSDGYYAYAEAKSYADNGNQNNHFKIALAADSWDYGADYLHGGFNGTDIENMGSWDSDGNCCIYHETSYYVLAYFPNTKINTTNKVKICASTFLPDDSETDLPEPEPVADVTVHFINSVEWAEVACHHWVEGGSATSWPGDVLSKTDEIAGYDVYTATFTGEHTSCIFNNNDKGNQTEDLPVEDGKYYDLSTTTWYADKAAAEAALATPIVKTYTVVGSSAPLFGSAWATDATANDMTLVEGTKYELVKNDITLAVGEIQYKVAVNHAWTEAYPSDNAILPITEAGKYKVTFTFDSNTKEVGATAELIEAAVVLPTIKVKGSWDGWTANTTLTGDDTSASATVNIATAGVYEFGLDVDGNFQASGATIDKTNNSTVVTKNDGNMKLTANVLGDYTFTWTYETKTLVVTYPAGEEVEIAKKYYIAGTENLTGFNWQTDGLEIVKDGDVYKHTFTELPAGEYQFKITDGQWNSEGDNTHEHTTLGATYEEVSYNEGNIKIVTDEAINLTVIFNAATDEITFEGLTKITEGLTYTVETPWGTEECYFASATTGWNFRQMEPTDEEYVFTITIVGAKETDEYKYACKADWDFAEVREADENGNTNRKAWTEKDVVDEWATLTYTVAGDNTAVFGAEWDVEIWENNMTLQEHDGTYVWTKPAVYLAGNVEFKVIKNHNWDTAWPTDNYVINITESAYYSLTIYYNPANNDITVVTNKLTAQTASLTMDGVVLEEMEFNGMNLLSLSGATSDWTSDVYIFLENYTGEDKAYDVYLESSISYNYNYSMYQSVSGQLTQTTAADGIRTFTGTLNVVFEGYDEATDAMVAQPYELTVTLVEKTDEATLVVVTDATVTLDAGLTMTGEWTDEYDGTTYPVLVTVPGFDQSVASAELDASITVGGEGEYDPWLGWVEGLTTVTVEDGDVTVAGVLENVWARIKLEVSISGTLPVVEEPEPDPDPTPDPEETPDYTRTVGNNQFGTICLPFGGTITGAVLYECVGKEEGKVYLGSVTTLTAGVPYIFQATATATELAVYSDGTTATEAGSSNGLHGTFEDETEVAAGNYILLGNTLYPSDGEAKVNANRAYLDMSGVPAGVPTQMPGRRYIGMSVQGENGATGVEDLFTTDAPVKVIENGQLIIIRDGVKYNVQGQVIR